MIISPQEYIRQVKAKIHLDKRLKEIEKNGKAFIKMNNTGVILPVYRGDAIHSRLLAIRAKYADEINSYEIVKCVSERANEIPNEVQSQIVPTQTPPTPPLSKAMTEEEKVELRRAKWREAARKAYAKKKQKKLAQAT